MNPTELKDKLEKAKRKQKKLRGNNQMKANSLKEWDEVRLMVKEALLRTGKDYKLTKEGSRDKGR